MARGVNLSQVTREVQLTHYDDVQPSRGSGDPRTTEAPPVGTRTPPRPKSRGSGDPRTTEARTSCWRSARCPSRGSGDPRTTEAASRCCRRTDSRGRGDREIPEPLKLCGVTVNFKGLSRGSGDPRTTEARTTYVGSTSRRGDREIPEPLKHDGCADGYGDRQSRGSGDPRTTEAPTRLPVCRTPPRSRGSGDPRTTEAAGSVASSRPAARRGDREIPEPLKQWHEHRV